MNRTSPQMHNCTSPNRYGHSSLHPMGGDDITAPASDYPHQYVLGHSPRAHLSWTGDIVRRAQLGLAQETF